MASFGGIIPPTVTLFNDDMSIDWDGTLRHLDWLIAAGVHGLFILGTTGEFTQFSPTERKEYAQKVVEHVKGRVPVIIGTGGVNTRETIDLTRHAKGIGADAAAVVTPFYQTLGDEQLLAHFGAVANAVDLPILVYNIPVFTGTAVSTPVLAQLAEENDNIVGVKDSVDSAALVRSRVQTLKRIRPDFSILTGHRRAPAEHADARRRWRGDRRGELRAGAGRRLRRGVPQGRLRGRRAGASSI